MKGKLSVVSPTTFGIKLDGKEDWINLAQAGLDLIEAEPTGREEFGKLLLAYKGKIVELDMAGHMYKGIKLAEQQTLPQEQEDIPLCDGLKDYRKLAAIKCNAEKKGSSGLSYITWAEAWAKLKQAYPEAIYKVYENDKGMPYFIDEGGYFVKVGVTVCQITHDVWMPVLDYQNKPLQKPTSFDINKSIQRALAKAIAMHGLGLYIYRGEDFPEAVGGQ